jgi:ferredoxin-NADP reductase
MSLVNCELMDHIVKILELRQVTHDVKQFRVEKPKGYFYIPGQATDVSVNRPDWKDEKRPFTFTGLSEDPYLQFTIKRYPERHGVTDLLHSLAPGDEIIVRDVWGAIEYKGPGCFIAGGAGITPFLAILRMLHQAHQAAGNTLYFSNKTTGDIIEHDELLLILGVSANFTLTRDPQPGYFHGRIDKTFLQDQLTDFRQPFYVCGTDEMVQQVSATLAGLGANPESLVIEK